MTDEMQSTPPVEANESAPLFDTLGTLKLLWESRWFILKTTAAATVLAVVVSLLLPEYFRSTAVLLPESDKSRMPSLGGLSDLASLAGVNVGGGSSQAKLYPTILESEATLKPIIFATYQTIEFEQPVNLIDFWEIEENTPERAYEVALLKLREELSVSSDNKTGVVSISLEMREPQLAADVINGVVRELDVFIRTKQTTNASEQRRWIETRLDQVQADLKKSENTLKEFRERNRRVGDSPLMMLAQERLLRDIQIHSTIYVELRKQHELAKIEEIKNIPIINVLDSARPAAKKDRPKRAFIVLSVFFAAAALSAGYVYVQKQYGSRLRNILATVGVGQKSAIR